MFDALQSGARHSSAAVSWPSRDAAPGKGACVEGDCGGRVVFVAVRLTADVQALRERYATLTHREREVMDLIVAGRMNKQIAFELTISEVTVKVHRGRVMAKMRARSLAELVRFSIGLAASDAAIAAAA
jgi:DNA-binding CsgD family transcriptional regulator